MEYILNKDVDGTDVTLRKLQLVLLDMMKDIDEICEKNDIHYVLLYGSILGAIRHDGFIPWDDDLDIGVTRDEYEKFIHALEKDLPDKYTFQYFEKDSRFLAPYPAMKIRLKNTYIEEKNFLLKNKCHECNGVFIDVIILNHVSNDKKEDLKWRKKNLYLSFLITFLENLDINPVRLKKKFIQNAIDYGNKNKNSELIGDEITWVYQSLKKPCIYKEKDVFPVKKVSFEGVKLPIPNNSDAILTTCYGDYMTPPKEEKRTPVHAKYVSLKSACNDRYHRHFTGQNLLIIIFLMMSIIAILSLLTLNEISFFITGFTIILLGIILILFINKKN